MSTFRFPHVSIFPSILPPPNANTLSGTARNSPFTTSPTNTSTSTLSSLTSSKSTKLVSGCPLLTLPHFRPLPLPWVCSLLSALTGTDTADMDLAMHLEETVREDEDGNSSTSMGSNTVSRNRVKSRSPWASMSTRTTALASRAM